MIRKTVIGLTFMAGCLFSTACHHTRAAAKAPPVTPAQTQVATNTPHKEYTVTQPTQSEVSRPSSRMPDEATKARIQDLLNRIQDAYFDYNKHSLRSDAETALKDDAKTLSDILRQYPDYKLTVEGYADERGSDEYNVALGDARAKQAKEYLANLGIPNDQLRTLSYGKEHPVCTEHDEACWQRNRRAHITQSQ